MASFSITTGVALILMHCPVETPGPCRLEEAPLPPLASLHQCWEEAEKKNIWWNAKSEKVAGYCVERDYRHPVK